MDDNQNAYVKGIIEALLLTTEKPLAVEQVKEIIDGGTVNDVREAMLNLQKDYQDRKSGMVIMEIAGGFQMLTNPDYAMYVKKFYRTKHKEKLSKPALETLAIVAYKQPVSRLDVELIRGVNCDGVILHLLGKELIEEAGRKDVPGRPYIYGTTKQFLEYFGLKSLEGLPKLEDFALLQQMTEESEKIQKDASKENQNEPSETAQQN